MKTSSKVMLILACVFVTLTFLLFAFDSFLEIVQLYAIFGPYHYVEQVFIFVYALLFVVIFAFVMVVLGGATLTFAWIFKCKEGWTWYSKVIYIATIVMMVMAVFYPLIVFIIKGIDNAVTPTSSSSMSSSALIY